MNKYVSLLLTLPFLVLQNCVQIPETGERRLMMSSVAQEKQIGEQGYKEILSKEKINRDPRLNRILQNVGRAIASQAAQSDFNWEFTLIDSEQLNAWCMPGGKVAFYTGILPYLKNEAGMAAVMGHEVAHAVLRHSGQRMSREFGKGALLTIASGMFSQNANHDQIMALMGVSTNVLGALPFSRKHETQSDIVGLKYMAKAGYDPQEAIRFWERFSQAGGSKPPEFLSTHPSGSTRIKTLYKHLPEAKKWYLASKKRGLGENLQ